MGAVQIYGSRDRCQLIRANVVFFLLYVPLMVAIKYHVSVTLALFQSKRNIH